MKEYLKKYQLENKEKLTAYKLAWKKEKMADPEYRRRQNELENIRRAKVSTPEQRAKAAARTALWKKANMPKVVANTTKRKKFVAQRTPKWLTPIDFERIETQYKLAAILTKLHNSPWQVDHDIPLKGKLVSGLHVPSNLRVIPAKDNLAKSNRFEV